MFFYYKLHKHVVQESRLDLHQLLQSLEHEELFLARSISVRSCSSVGRKVLYLAANRCILQTCLQNLYVIDGQIELSEIRQIPLAESFAVTIGQLFGKLLYDMLPVLGTFLTLLFFLNNALSNMPICFYHLLAYSRISTYSELGRLMEKLKGLEW